MEELSFEEQIRIENLHRNNLWHWKVKFREKRGENIWIDFCVWTNCQGDWKLRKSEKVFANWLKENNITLTEYQRRYLAQKYFGWKYTWNEETQQYDISKGQKQ